MTFRLLTERYLHTCNGYTTGSGTGSLAHRRPSRMWMMWYGLSKCCLSYLWFFLNLFTPSFHRFLPFLDRTQHTRKHQQHWLTDWAGGNSSINTFSPLLLWHLHSGVVSVWPGCSHNGILFFNSSAIFFAVWTATVDTMCEVWKCYGHLHWICTRIFVGSLPWDCLQ